MFYASITINFLGDSRAELWNAIDSVEEFAARESPGGSPMLRVSAVTKAVNRIEE